MEYLLLSRHYIMCHDSREDPEICAVIQATHVCTNRGNYSYFLSLLGVFWSICHYSGNICEPI